MALAEPASPPGGRFYEPEALAAVVDFTEGYPYFLQEYGNALWNQVEEVAADRRGCRGRAGRGRGRSSTAASSASGSSAPSELEQRYLRAMAELGSEPQRAKDVAALLGRTSEQLARRARA